MFFKHIFSLICIILSFELNAQIEIYNENNSFDISGTVFYLNSTNYNDNVINFFIENKGLNKEIGVMRTVIEESPNWTNSLCWGLASGGIGACYNFEEMNTNPWIAPSIFFVNMNEIALLTVYINPEDNISGQIHLRYHFIDSENSIIDSFDLVLKTNHLSTNKFFMNEDIKIHPNPCNGILFVKDFIYTTKFEIYNNQGHKIYSFTNENMDMIDLSFLSNGIYFLKTNVNLNENYLKLIIDKSHF
jgi:hypothetical protein